MGSKSVFSHREKSCPPSPKVSLIGLRPAIHDRGNTSSPSFPLLPLVYLLRGLDRQLDLTHCASSTISHRSSLRNLISSGPRHFSMSSVQRARFPPKLHHPPPPSSLLTYLTFENNRQCTDCYSFACLIGPLVRIPRTVRVASRSRDILFWQWKNA